MHCHAVMQWSAVDTWPSQWWRAAAANLSTSAPSPVTARPAPAHVDHWPCWHVDNTDTTHGLDTLNSRTRCWSNCQIIKSNKHMLNQTTSPQSFKHSTLKSSVIAVSSCSVLAVMAGRCSVPSVSCVLQGFYCHGSCPVVSSVQGPGCHRAGGSFVLVAWTRPDLLGDIHTFIAPLQQHLGLIVALLQPPLHCTDKFCHLTKNQSY